MRLCYSDSFFRFGGDFFPIFLFHDLTIRAGKIGEHLVQILAAKGAQVSVLARDPAKMKTSANVSAVKGDITDVAQFGKVAAGHERLFLLTNNQAIEPSLAEAARDAGVKHIVRISCWLADVGHENGSIFQMHGRVESSLEQLKGIAVTTLRPSDFFQNFLNYSASVKDPHQNHSFYHNAGEARVSQSFAVLRGF